MKKIIIWVLIVSIISQFTGCYTFQDIQINEDSESFDFMIENADLNIKLNSGEQLISNAYNHTYNNQSANLFLGQGTIYSYQNNMSESFGGKIFEDEIDSLTLKNNFLNIWLKNKDVVKFEKTKYFEVMGDTAKGLLLTDDMKLKIIPLEKIQSIEASEYNSTLTTITVIGAAVVLLGLIVALFGEPSLGGPILSGSF
jgi:hypothetical protein